MSYETTINNYLSKINKSVEKLKVMTTGPLAPMLLPYYQRIEGGLSFCLDHISGSGLSIKLLIDAVTEMTSPLEESIPNIFSLSDDERANIENIHRDLIGLRKALELMQKPRTAVDVQAGKRKTVDLEAAGRRKTIDELKALQVIEEYKKELERLKLDFTDATSSVQHSARALVKDAKKQTEELHLLVAENKKFVSDAENSLKTELAGLKIDLKDLAGHRTSQYFDSEAVEERDQAKYFRWGAIGCMVVVVIISLIGFGLHLYNMWTHLDATGGTAANADALKITTIASAESGGLQSSLSYWAAVFPVTIFLSLLAAYLARESTWHKSQASKLRRIAMNISTLEPFIGSLKPELQNEITAKVAESVFIASDTVSQEKDTFPINHQELIVALINKLDLGKKPVEGVDKNTKPDQSKT